MPEACRRMVPKRGLEPPHPDGYYTLNVARLPIPPLRRRIVTTTVTRKSLEGRLRQQLFNRAIQAESCQGGFTPQVPWSGISPTKFLSSSSSWGLRELVMDKNNGRRQRIGCALLPDKRLRSLYYWQLMPAGGV